MARGSRDHPLPFPTLASKKNGLMLKLTALLAALAASALPATVLASCAGLSDCSHYSVDVLIDLDHQQAILWSKAATVQQCQDTCHAKKTSYYRFKQGPGRGQGVCSCFNHCTSLTTGEATTGVVSKCKTSSLIKLHFQQAQDLGEDWTSLDPQDSSGSESRRGGGSGKASTADGADTGGSSVSGGGDAVVGSNDELVRRLEGQERLMQEQEQQQEGLMRVQQQKQLQSYRSMELPGWRVLHEKHQLLERKQVLFLEQQELYRRKRTQGRRTRVAQS